MYNPKLVKVLLISSAQMRAARGLLGWSQTKLGAEAGMSLQTVKRYETAAGAKVSDDAVEKLRIALELGRRRVHRRKWRRARYQAQEGSARRYQTEERRLVHKFHETYHMSEILFGIDAV